MCRLLLLSRVAEPLHTVLCSRTILRPEQESPPQSGCCMRSTAIDRENHHALYRTVCVVRSRDSSFMASMQGMYPLLQSPPPSTVHMHSVYATLWQVRTALQTDPLLLSIPASCPSLATIENYFPSTFRTPPGPVEGLASATAQARAKLKSFRAAAK